MIEACVIIFLLLLLFLKIKHESTTCFVNEGAALGNISSQSLVFKKVFEKIFLKNSSNPTWFGFLGYFDICGTEESLLGPKHFKSYIIFPEP